MKRHYPNRKNLPVLSEEEYMKTIYEDKQYYIPKQPYEKVQGRKTNIEKYNEQKGVKIVKKEIVLDFD
jgi:hypothetical protein